MAETQTATVPETTYGRLCPVCHQRFPSTEFRVHMDAEMDAYNAEKLEAEVMA